LTIAFKNVAPPFSITGYWYRELYIAQYHGMSENDCIKYISKNGYYLSYRYKLFSES